MIKFQRVNNEMKRHTSNSFYCINFVEKILKIRWSFLMLLDGADQNNSLRCKVHTIYNSLTHLPFVFKLALIPE